MRSPNGAATTKFTALLSRLPVCLGPAQARLEAVSGPERAEAGRSPPPRGPLVGPVSYQVPPGGEAPVDAGGPAAVGRGRAGARRGAAARLLDRERVTRLRRRLDRVVVRGRGRDRDRGLRQVEAGVLALDVVARVATRRVRAVVGVARLELRGHVAGRRLGVGVLALRLLAEEGRKSDGGKDADDENHNEELDEREALLLAAQTLGKLLKHVPGPP